MKRLLVLVITLCVCALGIASVYTDRFQLIRPEQDPYFYVYSSQGTVLEIRIYRLEASFGTIPLYAIGHSHYPRSQDLIVEYSVQVRTLWERIDLPHTFFQSTGRYLVAIREDKDAWQHMVVEKTQVDGVAIVYEEMVWVQLWNTLTGQPVQSGQIFTGDGFDISLGQVSSQGTARFRLDQTQDETLHISTPLGNAYIHLDYWIPSEKWNLVMVTDRPMYRPGDPVYIRGYLFDTGSGRFLTDGQVSLSVLDPRGREVLEGPLVLDSYGGFSYMVPTFSEDIRGHYRILVQYEDHTFTRYFNLSDYQKPTFTLEIDGLKQVYGLGETPALTIGGRYYFGQPLDQGIVTYKLYALSVDLHPGGEELLLSQSHALSGEALHLALKIPTDDHGRFRLEVTLVDSSERDVMETRYFEYIPLDVRIGLSSDSAWFGLGEIWEPVVVLRPIIGEPSLERPLMMQLLHDSQLVEEKPFTTDSQGHAQLRIPLAKAGRYMLRVFDPQNPDYFVSLRAFCYSASYTYQTTLDIDFIQDAPLYAPGDVAQIRFLSRYPSLHALVVINTGNQVWSRSIQLKNGETSLMIEIPNDITTNRIELRCIAFHGGRRLDRSLSLPVKSSGLGIDMSFDIPESAQPGASVPIHVKASDDQGQPLNAVLTLNLIDQALLDLYGQDDWDRILEDLDELPIRYWLGYFNESFFLRNRVGMMMQNGSLYDSPETLAQTKAAFDGRSIQVRSEFSDTAYWKDAIVIDGELLVDVTLPQDLTTWRVRGLAVGEGGRRGYQWAQFYTTLPVTVQPVFPKFLISGDQIRVGWLIGNYTGEDHSFDFLMEFEGQSFHQKIDIPQSQTHTAWFTIDVPHVDTQQPIRFFARAQSGEWGDAMIHTIPVHPRIFTMYQGASGFTGKEPLRLAYEASVPSALSFTLSAGLQSELLSALAYLIQYPYGCVEQTVSSFLPTIAAMPLVMDSDLPLAQTIREKIVDVTEKGLARLYGYQQYSGGWGWWRDDAPDLFMTAYVMYALYHLDLAGYDVNESVVLNGVEALEKAVRSSASNDSYYGFAFYVLKLFNPRLPVTMLSSDRLEDALFMALSLAQSGNNHAAKALLQSVLEAGRFSEGFFHVTFKPSGYMLSSLQLNALLLQLISDLEYEGPQRQGLVRYLFRNRQGDYWTSTKDTAFVTMALSKMPFFSEDYEAMVSIITSEGKVEGHKLTLKAEQDFSFTYTLPEDASVQILVEGDEGLIWKWSIEERHPLDSFDPEHTSVLHRELQKTHTFIAHQGPVDQPLMRERSIYITLDTRLGPSAMVYDLPSDPLPETLVLPDSAHHAHIRGFMVKADNSGQAVLWVNGENTGVPIHESIQIQGMSEDYLILSADPWGSNPPHPVRIYFSAVSDTLRVGDIIRSKITVDLPLPFQFAAMEERLPSSWVEQELYLYPYKSRSKFLSQSYYHGRSPDFVDIRYHLNAAFFRYLSSEISEYFNEYRIIAAGTFILPPLHLYEMYEETNAYQAPAVRFVVEP